MFLYCREDGRLEIDEDPQSWDDDNAEAGNETPAHELDHELDQDVMYVAAIHGYCQGNGQIIVR